MEVIIINILVFNSNCYKLFFVFKSFVDTLWVHIIITYNFILSDYFPLAKWKTALGFCDSRE